MAEYDSEGRPILESLGLAPGDYLTISFDWRLLNADLSGDPNIQLEFFWWREGETNSFNATINGVPHKSPYTVQSLAEWYNRSVTVQIPADAYSFNVGYYVYAWTTAGQQVQVRRVMLVKGQTALNWQPPKLETGGDFVVLGRNSTGGTDYIYTAPGGDTYEFNRNDSTTNGGSGATGKVAALEFIEGGTSLSAKYAPISHTHNASDINAGTLSNDRLAATIDTSAAKFKNDNTNTLTIDRSNGNVYSGITFNTAGKSHGLLYSGNDGSGNVTWQTRNFDTDGGFKATVFSVKWADGLVEFNKLPTNGGVALLRSDQTAAAATKLATARTISLTGDVTGSANFDGTGNVSISATVTGGTGGGGAFLGALSPETGRNLNQSEGVNAYRVSNASLGDGTPALYYSVLTFGGAANEGNAQIAASWTNNGDQLFFRSLRDTTDNWWAWKKIYHEDAKPTPGEIGAAEYSSGGTISNALANAAWVSNYGGASNVDHIWHDDTDNAWNFCSDTTFKGAGNSLLRAGGIQIYNDTDLASDNVRLGRSSSQFISLHGGAAGNHLTAVSSSSNPKGLKLNVSTDSGASVSGNAYIAPDGAFTASGSILSNGTAYYGDDKEIIRFSDGWLRLNPSAQFGSGIYCGASAFRTDGSLQVGSNGSNFQADSSQTFINAKLHATGQALFGVTNIYVNDGGGNSGIRFGADDSVSLEDGISWEIDCANDSSSGGITFGVSQALTAAGQACTYSSVLTLGSDKRVTFAGEFTVNSDETLKQNFRREIDVEALRDKLMRVEWLLFDWRDNEEPNDVFGVIAQEVQRILPECVARVFDRHRKRHVLTVNYQRINNYWALVNQWQEQRIQEQAKRLDDLETRLLKLEGGE